jgi:hypothetical protein
LTWTAEPPEDFIHMARHRLEQNLALRGELEIKLIAAVQHQPIPDLLGDGDLPFACERCGSHFRNSLLF